MDARLLPVLDAATQDALVRVGRPREFRPGEVIFHQGDPCESLFLLRRGRVAVHVLTPDGDQVTVGLIAAPDAFGEVGLVRADHHHTASVVALDRVHVLAVLAARFHEVRREHDDLTDWLLVTLTRRLERTSELLGEALFVDAQHRVARRLIDAHESFGAGEAGPLPLRQEDLAAMAGVSRPTANRALRRLVSQGVIRLGRCHVEVLDPAGLTRAAR